MSLPVYRWQAPGCEVVFSTRQGGVSEGPFESLNLGRRTGDDVTHVDENRRRLCALIDADEERLTIGFQTHSTVVRRAEAGSRGVPGDGLWTDEPDVPMLAIGADCVLMALARKNGGPPALAAVVGVLCEPERSSVEVLACQRGALLCKQALLACLDCQLTLTRQPCKELGIDRVQVSAVPDPADHEANHTQDAKGEQGRSGWVAPRPLERPFCRTDRPRRHRFTT